MKRLSGRKREAKLIREANRASAVGRLMLGEFNTWQEFLGADALELERLPRRQLKSGKIDVTKRLSPEIKDFCSKNFQRMTVSKLSSLYEDIKAFRGLEIPLKEFEKKYTHVNRRVLKGNPAHLTIVISLWGLQFRFPEDELAKNLLSALQLIVQTQKEIKIYKKTTHQKLEKDRIQVSSLIRKNTFAAHSAILFCYSLMEAYLNGLAWDYMQSHDTSTLSNTKKKRLKDTSSESIRNKLKKYPQDLNGNDLWQVKENEEILNNFLNVAKPFRDSLVHPSPFSVPEKFGGYDKLRLLYQIDHDTALLTANLLVSLIELIHPHVYGEAEALPKWFTQLKQEVENASNTVKKIGTTR